MREVATPYREEITEHERKLIHLFNGAKSKASRPIAGTKAMHEVNCATKRSASIHEI